MNKEKKMYSTMNYLIHTYKYTYKYVCVCIYIYPLHIEEIDMNKKSNVSLICGGVKLKSKS